GLDLRSLENQRRHLGVVLERRIDRQRSPHRTDRTWVVLLDGQVARHLDRNVGIFRVLFLQGFVRLRVAALLDVGQLVGGRAPLGGLAARACGRRLGARGGATARSGGLVPGAGKGRDERAQ